MNFLYIHLNQFYLVISDFFFPHYSSSYFRYLQYIYLFIICIIFFIVPRTKLNNEFIFSFIDIKFLIYLENIYNLKIFKFKNYLHKLWF